MSKWTVRIGLFAYVLLLTRGFDMWGWQLVTVCVGTPLLMGGAFYEGLIEGDK